MYYLIKDGNIEFSCAHYSGCLPFSISSDAIGKSGLADDDAGVLFLRSPYYMAAVDRFGVKLVLNGEIRSFGYLFPVSLLDKSNEQEYENMKGWQQDMLFIGYKRLLDFCHEGNKLYDKVNVVETLAEINVSEDVFMFIYDKKVEKDQMKFVPALYDKGFYLVKDPCGKEELYSSSFMKKLIMGQDHHEYFLLKEATESFVRFGFIKDLYENLLPYIKNTAFRYILLYQVIEYLMDLKKNETWFDSMATFTNKHCNELIHKLMDVGKEETLINLVFEGVKQGDSIYQEFKDNAIKLFEGVNKEVKTDTNFPAYMYGVRNILVHNLKEAIEYDNIIDELAERYEKIVCSLIMNIKIDECAEKRVFVYDLKQKYSDTLAEFSKILKE